MSIAGNLPQPRDASVLEGPHLSIMRKKIHRVISHPPGRSMALSYSFYLSRKECEQRTIDGDGTSSLMASEVNG
ncbi:hypothetical protein NL676_018169 [Syzygium grande]|nr:hypothetical protein NL676_018169 [Syzygium grande]